jgi:hypothetical protein
MHDLFTFVQTGVDPVRGVDGYFQSTGIQPTLLKKLQTRGVNLPFELFSGRRLQSQPGRGMSR